MVDQDLYVLVWLADHLQWPLAKVLELPEIEVAYRLAQLELARFRSGQGRQ